VAKNTSKNTSKEPQEPVASDTSKKSKSKGSASSSGFSAFMKDPRVKKIAGVFLSLFGIYLFLACLSYLISGGHDQYLITGQQSPSDFSENEPYHNWMGKIGAHLAHFFMFTYIGVGAFFVSLIVFLWGVRVTFQKELLPFYKSIRLSILGMLYFPLAIGFAFHKKVDAFDRTIEITCNDRFVGGYGHFATEWFVFTIGWIGTLMTLLFVAVAYLIFNHNHKVESAWARFGEWADERKERKEEERLKKEEERLKEEAQRLEEAENAMNSGATLEEEEEEEEAAPPFLKSTTGNSFNAPIEEKPEDIPGVIVTEKKTIISPVGNTFRDDRPAPITQSIRPDEPEEEGPEPYLITREVPATPVVTPPSEAQVPPIVLAPLATPPTDIPSVKPTFELDINQTIEEAEAAFNADPEWTMVTPMATPEATKAAVPSIEITPQPPIEELPQTPIQETPPAEVEMTTPVSPIVAPSSSPIIGLQSNGDAGFHVAGMEVEAPKNEDILSDSDLENKLQEFGPYDPKLDLSRYEPPSVELLKPHGSGIPQINKEELEANKNKIVETLNHYKIEIDKIKATIGPTVTLYEIVPAPGVRISKIKNLEDDIALSLAALGIRIIAPIPGKGTIGIEVPNSKPEIVSMKSLIASDKFQNSDMDLPVVLGKTISNENFVVDLAKMPHLLMAGATGQGKSVGLNAILVSLLYKKHPSQIKFVLVDPKKVELTLFNKIERHFLAKLPDSDEPIITDTSKVVRTLNSLCIEMDERYELLKTAQCRNIKEYNAKFISRRLNPENGHRYLPYIVLVVDEFADLIMTAGREVETPIARLAQLARAIGIHLIIATQRPSVNIITGTIKANFPARIAFRVTSKIDSRTILDAGGADQLIGRGDMLYSTGNDLIRIQCGFVDTPEVEEITDFIGSQQGYPHALHLPEVPDENAGESLSFSEDDRDALFEDAARIVVMTQQGSASLLQRKLKLGYNRAGRLVDQLEAAGIIGPFEGSKARKVLISDEHTLDQFLRGLNNNGSSPF
jgi:S-DNA-T family DNA segregation ATPase FtsK/SpoIIIE